MIEKLEKLNKEDLIEILFRIYDVHQKDVVYYESKKDSLLLNIHKTRIERIEQYVNSAIRKNN